MDREKLKVIREALNVEEETMESLAKNNAYWAYFGFLDDVLKKMVDALLEEPKPVVSEAKRSSYVFDVDFSCFSCQQVLSHLTRKNSKTKVRLCMGVDKKTWHFLEENV